MGKGQTSGPYSHTGSWQLVVKALLLAASPAGCLRLLSKPQGSQPLSRLTDAFQALGTACVTLGTACHLAVPTFKQWKSRLYIFPLDLFIFN